MTTCLLGIGANLGDPRQQVDYAIGRLQQHPQIEQLVASSLLETAPIGGPAGQGIFLNGALRIETMLAAESLRQVLNQIEAEAGRERNIRWDARKLDLDLLFYGDEIIATETLSVPHPRMITRRFVLEPAADIAGDLVHPVLGWTIGELFEHLNQAKNYLTIEEAPEVSCPKTSSLPLDDPLVYQLTMEGRGDCLAGVTEWKRTWDSIKRREKDSETKCDALEAHLAELVPLVRAGTWPLTNRWIVTSGWLGSFLEEISAEDTSSSSELFQKWQPEFATTQLPKLIVRLISETDSPPLADLPHLWNPSGKAYAPVLCLRRDQENLYDEISAAMLAMI
ncbi:Hypothetical protein PBC10988_24320 [Planctomycetales bacterium 10988]|nr:Hypothetical protein PBC10988_24320 [Planctomycetales bacterium 10988]